MFPVNEPPAIYIAMQNILEYLEPIKKDKKGHQFLYRGIDDAYTAIHPLLVQNKVLTIPTVQDIVIAEGVTTVTVRYDFTSLIDGSVISVVTVGQGKGNDDKSSNKALSGAHKYAIFQTFCIPIDINKPNAKVGGLDDGDAFQEPPTKLSALKKTDTSPSSKENLPSVLPEAEERNILFANIKALIAAHEKNYDLTTEGLKNLVGVDTIKGAPTHVLREVEKKLINYGIQRATESEAA